MLPSFVFQPGGQFEIAITQAADAVSVGVYTASEVGSLQSLTNPDDTLYLPNNTLVHLSTKLVLQNSSGRFDGTMIDYGSYTTVL
jgi:hypothetical protein